MNTPASGWQRDPTARHEYRYWDGTRWTDDVSDRGVTTTDPMPPAGPGADPTQVIDATQSYPTAPPTPTQSYGAPPTGYQSDGGAGFGPYGTLPNQPGPYGSGGVPPVPTQPADSGAKTDLFVGIGVLVIAAIAGLAFLLTKDDDNQDETSSLPLSEQTDPTDDPSGSVDDPSDSTDTTDTTDSGDTGDSGDSGSVDDFSDLSEVDPSEIDEDLVVPLLADELVRSGGFTEEQATCVSEALFDQVSIDELVEIGESGDVMGTLTPEQLSGLTGAIGDCMGL